MSYSFESIAGYETEKEELKRLCEIFSHRKKYQQKGADLPKGIIFYGETGTGKTLFSKVMANECGLEVLKIDLGKVDTEKSICRQVKKTFAKAAKRKEPTMVFFDELDKVLSNNREQYCTDRSKTLESQLLTLIDGMDSAGNIVFVATCNDYDALPTMLVRPGRLDKKIYIGMPSFSSRVEILKMYMQRSCVNFETPIENIAKECADFSGAALKTLVNECILRSREENVVSNSLLKECIFELKNEDIPRESSLLDDNVRACRNVGAFLVAKTFRQSDYVLDLDWDNVCNDYFNTLLSNYDSDYPDLMEEDVCGYYCKQDLINAITVLLGGYVAEELVFGGVYDNVSGYLLLADDILRDMAKQGMFGLDMIYSDDRNEILAYPPARIEKLNDLFDETLRECYEQAKSILSKNKKLIEKLIRRLAQCKTIQKEACETLLTQWSGMQN